MTVLIEALLLDSLIAMGSVLTALVEQKDGSTAET